MVAGERKRWGETKLCGLDDWMSEERAVDASAEGLTKRKAARCFRTTVFCSPWFGFIPLERVVFLESQPYSTTMASHIAHRMHIFIYAEFAHRFHSKI